MDYKEMIKLADEAKEKAYSPFSKFKVGALLIAEDGTAFTGCNVENSSYGATNCAERTAIFKAVSEGYTKFSKIAIMSSSGDFTFPCGICRQVIFEFFDEDGEIVLGNKDGDIKIVKVIDMLPEGFKL